MLCFVYVPVHYAWCVHGFQSDCGAPCFTDGILQVQDEEAGEVVPKAAPKRSPDGSVNVDGEQTLVIVRASAG